VESPGLGQEAAQTQRRVDVEADPDRGLRARPGRHQEVEVGDAIPEAYYEAISRLLAHVAKIDARVAAKYAAMGR